MFPKRWRPVPKAENPRGVRKVVEAPARKRRRPQRSKSGAGPHPKAAGVLGFPKWLRPVPQTGGSPCSKKRMLPPQRGGCYEATEAAPQNRRWPLPKSATAPAKRQPNPRCSQSRGGPCANAAQAAGWPKRRPPVLQRHERPSRGNGRGACSKAAEALVLPKWRRPLRKSSRGAGVSQVVEALAPKQQTPESSQSGGGPCPEAEEAPPRNGKRPDGP